MPTALLIHNIDHARKEWEELSSVATLKEYPTGSREDFLSKIKNGEYDDVVAIYRSNESTKVTGPFNKELVDALPPSVKYICHNGAGYDNVDVPACTAKGIFVTSTPVAVNNATADIAIFLMIGALRSIQIPMKAIRDKQWRGESKLGYDPRNKTFGILGMGGIGTEVAKRALAFGCKIVYHNRTRLSSEIEQSVNASYVSFDELLAQSDILSLNLSLNKNTRHIISKPEFAKMKDGVTIINTARGALMNEKDLVEALANGKVRSVGLDVYENEPEIEQGLLDNPKVCLLPHIGTATWETQKEMEQLVLENLKNGIEGKELVTQVPEQLQDGKSIVKR